MQHSIYGAEGVTNLCFRTEMDTVLGDTQCEIQGEHLIGIKHGSCGNFSDTSSLKLLETKGSIGHAFTVLSSFTLCVWNIGATFHVKEELNNAQFFCVTSNV